MNIKFLAFTTFCIFGLNSAHYTVFATGETPVVTEQLRTDTTVSLQIASDDASQIRLPNGNILRASQASYTVNRNGTYDFVLTLQDGTTEIVTHTVKQLRSDLLVTATPDVSLELQADDTLSGVELMRFRNESSGAWSEYEPFQLTKDWTLDTATDGLKSVYVMYRDKATNESVSVYDQIYLDQSGPVINPFTINNGDEYTKTSSATLNIQALDDYSDVSELRISNDNVNWTTFPYNDEIEWELSSGTPGTRTVYAQAVDSLGNIGSVVSDTIYFDDVLPFGTISINNGDELTNSRDVKLQLSFGDAHAGVKRVTLIEGSNSYTFPTVPNSPTEIDWTLGLGATATVTLEVEDNAGNIYRVTSNPITIATLEVSSFTLNHVTNPISFPSTNPFKPITWTFPPQPMLAGGKISFDLRYALELDAATTADMNATYTLELVNESTGYNHAIVLPYDIELSDGFEASIQLPSNAPAGTKVYISSHVTADLTSGSNTFTDEAYFPNVGERAYIGDIIGNIKESIKFNETS